MRISQLIENPLPGVRRHFTFHPLRPFPTLLYKYRTGLEQYLDRLIVHNELFLSPRSSFNDPMDTSYEVLPSPSAQLRRECLINMAKSQRWNLTQRKKLLDQINTPEKEIELFKGILKEEADKIGIFSFSETPRSMLMWPHYAANHSGICLQYYMPAAQGLSGLIMPVRYVEDLVGIRPQDSVGMMIEALRAKSIHWNYEEEWRFLRPNSAGTTIKLPAETLIGVIYGARCNEKVRENVRSLLEERQKLGYRPLYEYQAHLAPSFYHVGIFSSSSPPSTWRGRKSSRNTLGTKNWNPAWK